MIEWKLKPHVRNMSRKITAIITIIIRSDCQFLDYKYDEHTPLHFYTLRPDIKVMWREKNKTFTVQWTILDSLPGRLDDGEGGEEGRLFWNDISKH